MSALRLNLWLASAYLPTNYKQLWQTDASHLPNHVSIYHVDLYTVIQYMIVTQLKTKGCNTFHGRQPNTSLLDLEEWTAAHEELSKQARLEMQLIATHFNYQFPGHEERQLLNLTTPNNLNFDKLAEEHNIVFLHGRPPKPADLVDGGTASGPLQFPEKTVTSFQNMWKSCAHGRPCIFAVVEDAACADDFFLQLKVSKPAVLKANLQQKSRTWKEGRIACIGALLSQPEHVSSISKLLKATEPAVEPVLSLIVTVLCGDTHRVHDMVVSLFMHDEQDIKVSQRL